MTGNVVVMGSGFRPIGLPRKDGVVSSKTKSDQRAFSVVASVIGGARLSAPFSS
jgi:hypothetical protein